MRAVRNLSQPRQRSAHAGTLCSTHECDRGLRRRGMPVRTCGPALCRGASDCAGAWRRSPGRSRVAARVGQRSAIGPGCHRCACARAAVSSSPHLFGGFDPGHFPTTSLPGLACAYAAYRHDPRTGEAMSLALRHALFEDGLDISQPAVLSDLSDSLNIGPYGDADNEGVRREWEEGVRRGVRGSPHFYCGDVDAFCPSLDISRDTDGVLTVRKDTAVLRSFLTNCFGG